MGENSALSTISCSSDNTQSSTWSMHGSSNTYTERYSGNVPIISHWVQNMDRSDLSTCVAAVVDGVQYDFSFLFIP